jgi:hypothetical protein
LDEVHPTLDQQMRQGNGVTKLADWVVAVLKLGQSPRAINLRQEV